MPAQTPPLALSNLVDITVSVSPSAVVAPTFNQGLFVGPSTTISSYGLNPRLRQYPNTTAMLADGFTATDPEFIAAQIYFSQTPAPQFIWIGRQDLTAIGSAIPDGRTVQDGVMSTAASSAYLVSATAAFTAADVGKDITIVGAGAGAIDLVTTIASVINSFVAVLAADCATSVTAAVVVIGRVVADGDMSSVTNPTYLDSATAVFVAGDVGATVIVAGAGTAGADLITTIASLNSGTEAVLVDPCLTTVSNAKVTIGRVAADGVMSTTTAATFLASVAANFQAGDVGSAVRVTGAGLAGADLVTTIASVTAMDVVVLALPCLTNVVAVQTGIGNVGAGYKAGDVITVQQSNASYGQLTVLTVGEAGQVITLGITPGTQGTGYSTAAGLSVTGGTGAGLEVDITAGESLLQASQACRIASTVWYGLAVNNPSDADNLALAEWADPLWATTRYYAWSSTTVIANGIPANLALQMQTLKLRVLGIYSTTQYGLYPNNVYAAAGLMGVEMGLNTGLAGSFFSIAYKSIAGIAPEPLTQTQYTNIVAAGFNAYCNFSPYQLVQPGFMSNGAPSYLWLNLAMLVSYLQLNELGALQALPVVPQTNAGEHILIQAANAACAQSAAIGFLADGIWEGVSINIPGVQLTQGQAIPGGYLNQSQPYSQQSINDRDAGKAMPIYCAITSAGAVQSLLIGVYAQF
jgi:hypothetical protein